jgi:hypothetical protein
VKAHTNPALISGDGISVDAVPLRPSTISMSIESKLTSDSLPSNAPDTLAAAWQQSETAAAEKQTSAGSLNDIENGWGSRKKTGQTSDDSANSGKLVGLAGVGSGSLRHHYDSRKSANKTSFAAFSSFLGHAGSADENHHRSGSGRLTASPTTDPLHGGSEFVMNVGNERVSFCRASEVAASGEVADIPVGEALFPESDEQAEIVRRKLAKRAAGPKEKLRSDFAFRDYLPQAFHKVRQLSKIDDMDYMDAFTETTRENFSEGRSGAFLYFSKNERFIVKTTSKHEMMKLLEILPDYVEYITQFPLSLLTRYLSAHAIVMYDTTLYFVVMLNIFPGADLSEKYDLKGSWIDRNGNNAGGKGMFT